MGLEWRDAQNLKVAGFHKLDQLKGQGLICVSSLSVNAWIISRLSLWYCENMKT